MNLEQAPNKENQESQIKRLESLLETRANQLDKKLRLTNLETNKQIIEELYGPVYDEIIEDRNEIYMKDIIYRVLSRKLDNLKS